MAAIRELLAEVREDAVAGALLGDADVDDVLLIAVTLLLEVVDDEKDVEAELITVDFDETVEAVEVNLVVSRETNVSSLSPPKLLSPIFVICKMCS